MNSFLQSIHDMGEARSERKGTRGFKMISELSYCIEWNANLLYYDPSCFVAQVENPTSQDRTRFFLSNTKTVYDSEDLPTVDIETRLKGANQYTTR